MFSWVNGGGEGYYIKTPQPSFQPSRYFSFYNFYMDSDILLFAQCSAHHFIIIIDQINIDSWTKFSYFVSVPSRYYRKSGTYLYDGGTKHHWTSVRWCVWGMLNIDIISAIFHSLLFSSQDSYCFFSSFTVENRYQKIETLKKNAQIRFDIYTNLDIGINCGLS